MNDALKPSVIIDYGTIDHDTGRVSSSGSISDDNDNNDDVYSPYPSLLEPPKLQGHGSFVWNRAFLVTILGILVCGGGIVLLILSTSVLPHRQENDISANIHSLYYSTPYSKAFNNSMSSDYHTNGQVYRLYWFYNVSNWYKVLYEGHRPITNLVGPFVYSFDEYRMTPTVTQNVLSYVPHHSFSIVTDKVTFKGTNGESDQTYKPVNPETTWLRVINPVLMGFVHQLLYNPFNESSFNAFRTACSRSNTTGNVNHTSGANHTTVELNVNRILVCLDEAFRRGSGAKGDKTTLNSTLSSIDQGLIPLRRATEWLGLRYGDATSDALWVAVDKYVRFTYDTHRSTSWAYFVNSSVPDPNRLDSYIKPEKRMYDGTELETACTVYATNGLSVIHSWNVTKYSRPNVLNFHAQFAGWDVDIYFPDSHLRDGLHTHPYVSMDLDDSFSVWESSLYRPLRFSSSYALKFRDLDVYRYQIDDSNYENWLNSEVFFSKYSDVMNASQSRSYQPVFVGNPLSMIRSYMDVEPKSGMVVNRAFRYQYWVDMRFIDFTGTGVEYELYNNSNKRNLVPVLIAEDRYQCSGDQADTYRSFQDLAHTVRMIRTWGSVLGGLVTLLGILLICYGCVRLRKMAAQSDKKQPIYPNTSSALIYDTERSKQPVDQ